MMHKPNIKPIAVEIEELGRQIQSYRLSRNLSQDAVASNAGITRRTLGNLEAGKGASLDTLFRTLRALDLGDRLGLLVPPIQVNPLDRGVGRNKERQRASPSKDEAQDATPWQWGD